jgi:hypothetical protein
MPLIDALPIVDQKEGDNGDWLLFQTTDEGSVTDVKPKTKQAMIDQANTTEEDWNMVLNSAFKKT